MPTRQHQSITLLCLRPAGSEHSRHNEAHAPRVFANGKNNRFADVVLSSAEEGSRLPQHGSSCNLFHSTLPRSLATILTLQKQRQTDKMRFQDWDVLLFPAGSQVPVREFRTACFAQQNGLTVAPLLTCFVPSLESGAAFQVSVHSWTKPTSILGPHAGYAAGAKYVWRIKMAVDGVSVVNATFSEAVSWPRQFGELTGSCTRPSTG